MKKAQLWQPLFIGSIQAANSPSAKDVFQLYLSFGFKEGPPFLGHKAHEHLIDALCDEAHYNYKSRLERWMLLVLLYHFLSLFHLQI